MPKNFFQDMVAVKKQKKETLIQKDIQIKPKKRVVAEIEKEEEVVVTRIRVREPKESNSYGLWILAIVCIVFLFFTFSSFFARAHVSINPKIISTTLSETIIAKKDLSVNETGLSYQLMILEAEDKKNIQGGGEEAVEEKAKGKVILYNAYSSSPQSLDINTRLESSKGKIYKTDSKVSIPGMSDLGIPGSVEVDVTALESGEAYNDELTDFVVSAFKNTSKASKFYGRSTSVISGGFKGLKKIVNLEDQDLARKELEANLQTTLLQKAREQLPEGYILFKDATFFKFASNLEEASTEVGTVPFSVKGTLYGFLFKETNLINEIMNIKFPAEKDRNIYIQNLEDLSFSLSDKELSFVDAKSITFKLVGPVSVVSLVEKNKILSDLKGKKKKDFNNILSAYKNIDSADLVIKPIWESDIPDKVDAIKVEINYPKEL